MDSIYYIFVLIIFWIRQAWSLTKNVIFLDFAQNVAFCIKPTHIQVLFKENNAWSKNKSSLFVFKKKKEETAMSILDKLHVQIFTQLNILGAMKLLWKCPATFSKTQAAKVNHFEVWILNWRRRHLVFVVENYVLILNLVVTRVTC